jgi:hypothetical protein
MSRSNRYNLILIRTKNHFSPNNLILACPDPQGRRFTIDPSTNRSDLGTDPIGIEQTPWFPGAEAKIISTTTARVLQVLQL